MSKSRFIPSINKAQRFQTRVGNAKLQNGISSIDCDGKFSVILSDVKRTRR